jgi:hypothetical protein
MKHNTKSKSLLALVLAVVIAATGCNYSADSPRTEAAMEPANLPGNRQRDVRYSVKRLLDSIKPKTAGVWKLEGSYVFPA